MGSSIRDTKSFDFHLCYACGYSFYCHRIDDWSLVDAYAKAKGCNIRNKDVDVESLVCLDCMLVQPPESRRLYNVCSHECQDTVMDMVDAWQWALAPISEESESDSEGKTNK